MAFPRTAWLVTLLFLVGCTAPAVPAPPAPTNSPVVPSVSPSPSPTSSVLASMSAADGRPMLWPARRSLEPAVGYGGSDDVRYGFVDVRGKLVVPHRYEGYDYCPDATGRTAFLIGTLVGKSAEVFDLSGKLLMRTPTAHATCGGAGHVIITEVIDGETGKQNSGLADVTTGKVVLPMAKDRRVDVVDARTVNVSDPSGEYFLDVDTGRRTPHKGWWTDEATPGQGELLVMAAKRPTDSPDEVKVGFIKRSGAWVVPPELEYASGFSNGYAIIKVDSQFTFLNAALERTGGTWYEIETIMDAQANTVLGYHVTVDEQQGLLGPDLKVILAPGPVSITCNWAVSVACSVVARDGSAALVLFPGGTTTAMPAGFTSALSPSFLADEVETEEGQRVSRRVYAVASGVSVELAAPTGCAGVGSAWAACETGAGMAPPVVIDTAGRVTGFATALEVPDPSPTKGGAYYWVTAGKYQGFVDATGTWRYRESRFTQLED